jgi:hypothetical protein
MVGGFFGSEWESGLLVGRWVEWEAFLVVGLNAADAWGSTPPATPRSMQMRGRKGIEGGCRQ